MNTSKIRDYYVKEKIGSGAYGIVYRAMKQNDKSNYVIKSISLSGLNKVEVESVKQESKVLAKINSTYVVKHFESFIEKNKLIIVMEYCEQGDLSKLIQRQRLKKKPFEEKLIWQYFLQICLGLKYLHDNKILHRDVKTLNVFITGSGQIRIGDLGVAKSLMFTNNANTMVGTPYYLSPEICNEKSYDHKSDVWSLGVLLYELVTLSLPFNANNQGALVLKIIKGEYAEPSTKYSNLTELIRRILVVNPSKRPSIQDILALDGQDLNSGARGYR